MSRRRRIGFWLAFAVVLALSAWLRKPGFVQGGFANHDVGGIMYNGMLLAAGKLPYVDSVEFKAPGTFYLAWLLGGGGRDIAAFQVWANVFALGSLALVMLGAYRLWGAWSGIVAGLVYGLHDVVLDTMDANYITWAQLPAIGAVVLALSTLRSRSPPGWVFALAGALACAATLCKRPAGIALLVVVVVAASTAWQRPPEGRTRVMLGRIGAVFLGVAAAALPVSVHYASAGEFGGLWRGFVLSEWGWRYVAQGSAIHASEAPREAVYASAYFLALPLALGAFALGGLAERKERLVLATLLLWSGLALASAAIGFRFYKGYYLAAAAPLSLLAAAPSGLLGTRSLRRWSLRLVALLPALLLVGRQSVLIEAERKNRMHAHDLGGRAIAKRVLQVTEPGDTLWLWGWHLWDVYAFTGRLSSTRFYKTMELTTSANDSTWRHPRSPLHFRDDLAAKALLAELEASPPDYIVLGSAVPVREFAALRRFLHTHYRRDRGAKLNRVQFWERRES
ncbi:MAG: hypothetical protein ACE37F_31745 [Nannocystaceae bacterium]|nr:hypothetical protein [bacterium]